METNKNNSQLKKLGKIEGVIYVEDAEGAKGSGTNAPSGGEKEKNTQGTVPAVTSADAGTSHQGQSPCVPQAAREAEPTKGIQTYVPMSVYRRLNDIKLSRGETIGNLVAEAVILWLDVQEGKVQTSQKV